MPNYSSQSSNGLTYRSFSGPFLLALMLFIGVVVGYRLGEREPLDLIQRYEIMRQDPPRPVYGRLDEVLRFIDARYIDEYSLEELEERAISTLLHDLDPHSAYIPRELVATINEQMNGEFEGIGIEFTMIRDTVVVMATTNGSPAHRAGIRPGDRIVAAGDSLLVGGISIESVAEMLQGEKGTPVSLTILKHDDGQTLTVNLVRGTIPIASVPAAFMLNRQTAYMRISRFTSTTYKEFVDHLERLSENDQFRHLVIDLRDNPGGYLEEATKILNQMFAEADKLLMYMEGDHSRRSERKSTGKKFFQIDQIAVLINGESASASEIVAGALQDWDRAVIIGRQSYGKGLVQEQYDLTDGSALRLTVAKYYTPSGRCIQRPYNTEPPVGDRVAYDPIAGTSDGLLSTGDADSQTNGQSSEYTSPEGASGAYDNSSDTDEFSSNTGNTPGHDHPHGESQPAGTTAITTGIAETEDKTNPDAVRTFSTAGGRTVFAEGGITPDIEVALDSGFASPAAAFIRSNAKRFLAIMPADWFPKPSGLLDNPTNFYTTYELPSGTAEQFEQFAREQKQSLSESLTTETLLSPELFPLFRKQLLMAIASWHYGESQMYQVSVIDDPDVEEALAALARKNPLSRKDQ